MIVLEIQPVTQMIEAVYDVMDKTAGKLLWNPKWEEEKPKIVDGLMPTLYSNIQRYFEKENRKSAQTLI
jgi:hypothetical protein